MWVEIEALARIVDRMEAMQGTSSHDLVQTDIEFHRAVWNMSGNDFLSKALNHLVTQLLAHALIRIAQSFDPRLIPLSHRPLLQSVRGERNTPPEDLMSEHLSLT